MGPLPYLYSVLKTPAVRDLAFAVLSEPLHPNLPVPLRHPLSASLWHHEPHRLCQWLIALDKKPAPLLNALSPSSHRLGRYYEALWLFALEQAPDVHVLAHNQVIYEGKRSLGEIDFLLEDQEGVHHLELAVKFYLAPSPDEQDLDLYQGPASHDTLGAKLRRLNQHQLKLCERAEAKNWLKTQKISNVKSSAWLSGTLFYSATKPLWRHQSNWQSKELWVEIPRERWLSPFLTDNPTPLTLNPLRAQMLARVEENGGIYFEQERALVVPDHWPGKAPSPLHTPGMDKNDR